MTYPKTKVIHSRIDMETLLSVVEFYDSRGGAEADPLSTKVSVVLATLMRSLRESGEVPLHSPDEVEELLNANLSKPTLSGPISFSGPRELYRPEPETADHSRSNVYDSTEGPPALDDSTEQSSLSTFDKASSAPNPREALRAFIDKTVEELTTPKVELDPDIWAPDPTELPDTGEFELDLDAQPKLPVTDLPEKSPVVREALALLESEEDSSMLEACQIVYCFLDPDEYLEPQAAQLVSQVQQLIVRRNMEQS